MAQAWYAVPPAYQVWDPVLTEQAWYTILTVPQASGYETGDHTPGCNTAGLTLCSRLTRLLSGYTTAGAGPDDGYAAAGADHNTGYPTTGVGHNNGLSTDACAGYDTEASLDWSSNASMGWTTPASMGW